MKFAFHDTTGRRIVEVYGDDGAIIGVIYPTNDGSNSIHIVSRHFADDPISQPVSLIPVPSYLVQFKRRP